MKYTKVIYKNEIQSFIKNAEIYADEFASDPSFKSGMQTVIHELDKFIKEKCCETSIIDIRLMKSKKGYFPEKVKNL